MARHILFGLLSAGLIASSTASSLAQQTAPSKAPAKSAPSNAPPAAPKADAAAPPQNDPAPQSGWASSCLSAARADAADCKVEQRLFLTNTGQLLAAVTVRVDGKTRQPSLMVQLPHGLFLPDGLALQIDETETLKLSLQTCDQSGCYAGAPAEKKLLDAMTAGTQLKLTFKDLNKKDIQVGMPLLGFGPALNKVR